MKSLSILFFLIYFTNLNAQIENINLPTGGKELSSSNFRPMFNVYVDKSNKIHFEKEQIEVHEIAKKLTYGISKLHHERQIGVGVLLSIDATIDYNLIDKIKTEIAQAYIRNIYYKTKFKDDNEILKGIRWQNYESFFHLQRKEKLKTDAQIEKNKIIRDSLSKFKKDSSIPNIMPPPPPPLPPLFWRDELKKRIYADQQEIIDEILVGKTYQCVKLTNKGYEVDKEIISFGDIEKLQQLFYTNNALFVNFDKNLKYTNYLKAIKYYKKLNKRNLAVFVEISKEIGDIHKLSKVSICN